MSNTQSSFRKSWNKHPILWNLGAIFVSLFILAYLALCFLDLWTHHGSTTVVPDVVGMDIRRGILVLEDAHLEVEIADSVYTKSHPPGSIVDVIPQPNSVVKKGREVYVTIVAFSPEPVIIDILLVDASAKQAEAYLRSKGLRVEKRYVPSEYADIVVSAKCNGQNLTVGSRVTVDDTIVLEVGKVPEPEMEEMSPLDMLIESSVETYGDSEEGSFEAEIE